MILFTKNKTVFLFSLLFLTIQNLATAQILTKQLHVLRGGNLPFVFSSLNDYTNGKTLGDTLGGNNWTRLSLSFTDTTAAGEDGASNGFQFIINVSSNIIADGSSPDLPIDSLRVFSKVISSENSILTAYNKTLLLGDNLIIDATDTDILTGHAIIELSFRLNVGMGRSPDYYYTDLVFILREK